MARRTAQLQEMRDKLKERNRKADMARLKRDLSQGGGDGSVDLGISGMGGGGDMESGWGDKEINQLSLFWDFLSF